MKPSMRIMWGGKDHTHDLDKAIGNALEESFDDAMRDMTISVLSALIESPPAGTPIDTHWAQANWKINLTTPSDTPVGDRTPSGVAFAKRVQEQSVDRLINYKIAGREHIYIVNNCPYIGDLDRGTSKQSGAGWIDRGIQRGIKEAESWKPNI